MRTLVQKNLNLSSLINFNIFSIKIVVKKTLNQKNLSSKLQRPKKIKSIKNKIIGSMKFSKLPRKSFKTKRISYKSSFKGISHRKF